MRGKKSWAKKSRGWSAVGCGRTARKYPFSEKWMLVTGPSCPSNLATFVCKGGSHAQASMPNTGGAQQWHTKARHWHTSQRYNKVHQWMLVTGSSTRSHLATSHVTGEHAQHGAAHHWNTSGMTSSPRHTTATAASQDLAVLWVDFTAQ